MNFNSSGVQASLAAAFLAAAGVAHGGFDPEFRVNTLHPGQHVRPRIAADAEGNFVVLWQDDLQGIAPYWALPVMARRYDAEGRAIGEPLRVDAGEGSDGLYSVASNVRGDWGVAYSGSDGVARFRRFSKDGVPDDAPLDLGLAPDERLARGGRQVAMDAAGGFAVVTDGAVQFGTLDIRVRLYTHDNSLRAVVPLDLAACGLHPGWAHEATLGMGPNGDFVVAWNDTESPVSSGLDTRIYARAFSPDGLPLGLPFRVDGGGLHNLAPEVAVDAGGNFTISWSMDQEMIRARRYAAGGVPLGDEFDVSPSTQVAMGDIAMDPDGSSVITWYAVVDGSREDIFMRRYAATGAALDSEPLQVNASGGHRTQLYPVVALDGHGRSLFAWQDDDDGNEGADIHARRFLEGGATHEPVDKAAPANETTPEASAGGFGPAGLLLLAVSAAWRRRTAGHR